MSSITPVPVSNGISKNYLLTIQNEYDKYEKTVGYWNDIDKVWKERSSGEVLKNIVNYQELDK